MARSVVWGVLAWRSPRFQDQLGSASEYLEYGSPLPRPGPRPTEFELSGGPVPLLALGCPRVLT
jgi:hypothetical protein